jgi:hypothetical protein
MWTKQSVRSRAAQVPGGGPVTVPGSPPSFLRYLTDNQLGGVAAFVDLHGQCEEPEFDLTWDQSFFVVLLVRVSCPTCGYGRSYHQGRG